MSDHGLAESLSEALDKIGTSLEYGGNKVLLIGAVLPPDGTLVVKAHVTDLQTNELFALISGLHYQLHQTLKQAAEQ